MDTEPRRSGPRDGDREYNLKLLSMLRMLVTRAKLILGAAAVSAALAVAVSFLVTPQYEARGRFAPEIAGSGQLPGGLAGLASQFGVNVSQGGLGESPQFYAELLRTQPVVQAVLLANYCTDYEVGCSPADSVSLVAMLDVGHDRNERRRLEEGLRELSERTSVSVDRGSGIVTVSALMPAPELAAHVVSNYLTLLDEYNSENRRSRARARRLFVEGLLDEARQALVAAEDSLTDFYERNREWQQSPALREKQGRIRRSLEMRQEVFVSLRRELDEARIAEVNDTPVLTILQPAVPPARKSKPRRLQWAWVSFVLSGLLVTVGAFLFEHRAYYQAVDPEGYDWVRGLVRRPGD
jgi:uncharacterized protein involved in exopolysaccharide biosynthesis